MIGSLLRVVIGFALAAIAAGLALVLHAETPSEIMSRTGGAVSANDLWPLAQLALKAGTHIAIFSAPLALIVAAIAEWQRARGLWFYLLAGLAIAASGFMAQQASEAVGQRTVLNEYAMQAFAIAGLAAGFVYWLVAGRCAGGCGTIEAESVPEAERHADPHPVSSPVPDAEVVAAKPAPARSDAAAKASEEAAKATAVAAQAKAEAARAQADAAKAAASQPNKKA